MLIETYSPAGDMLTIALCFMCWAFLFSTYSIRQKNLMIFYAVTLSLSVTAVENIILTALSDGVGACWMAAIDREEIGKLIGLKEGHVISCVVALGYSMENPKEVSVNDGIKYYLDETNTLCVPKRSMNEVLIKQL